MRKGFDTARDRDEAGGQGSLLAALGRYKPQVLVSFLVVLVLAGGAFYASRVSEQAPRVVYSASLEEVVEEANQPLLVNINTAGVSELEELPSVGPVTAQKIVDYRESNGMFRSVDDLVSAANSKTVNLSFSALVSDTSVGRLELARV